MVAARLGWELLAALWQLGAWDRSTALVAGTAAAVALLLAVALAARLAARPTHSASPSGFGEAPRQRARRTGTPRHTDPDAPGRARPRAPCAALAAAYVGDPRLR